jgi:hypothetical membrane protein
VRAERRAWSWAALVAQVLFVLGWLIAPAWQGPGYSVLAHSISDMYAVTAPHGLVLVVLLTACGVVTIGFALRAVRPVLRPGGRRATVGAVLLAASIFGLGDLLSPFEQEGCRLADPGCTPAAQLAAGGLVDTVLSTVGILLLVPAGFLLASAMRRTPGWSGRAATTRWFALALVVAFFATGLTGVVGLSGLAERVAAAVGAVGIGLLAVGVLVTQTERNSSD